MRRIGINPSKVRKSVRSEKCVDSFHIHPAGWVDVNECLDIIRPSGAEGGGGNVITCVHAGIIFNLIQQKSNRR